jgi:5'-nucleotidase
VPAINASITRLRAAKVDAIVLLIHEGLNSPTSPQVLPIGLADVSGRLGRILADIDPGVDLVVSGHTHSFSNILFRGKDPRPMLVTQARVDGTSYATTQLLIDPAKHAVVEKSSTVQTVWSTGDPGRRPDEKVAKLIKQAAAETASKVARPAGEAAEAITRAPSDAGESALGNLVADAQRAAAKADIAFMNPGGLRADLPAGQITWGALYTIQPFGNHVMRCTMTGEQILRLLESQWSGLHADRPTILKVSGLSYLYNTSRASGRRVVAAYDAAGNDLDPKRRYTVAVSDYLLGGGDKFPLFNEITDGIDVEPDIDALVAYTTNSKQPVSAKIEGRITRVSSK